MLLAFVCCAMCRRWDSKGCCCKMLVRLSACAAQTEGEREVGCVRGVATARGGGYAFAVGGAAGGVGEAGGHLLLCPLSCRHASLEHA